MPKRPSMQDRKPETRRTSATSDAALMGQERPRREVVDLLIREVMPNRQQPRTIFDEVGLNELANSIRIHGVLEPIIVREIPLTAYDGYGCQYELIAGERRWRAALLAEIAAIPALVLPQSTSDQTALELAITENLQREDLHPMDEAIAFGHMQRDLGYSYAQIAERLGKSKGYVQNRLRLLQLDDDLRQLVAERPDTLSHVYEVAKIKDPAQRRAVIDAVRREQLSVPETRARVQAILAPPSARTAYLRKYDREEMHEESADATAGAEPYLRKYDREEMHEESADATAGAEPYLRKYDREEMHEESADATAGTEPYLRKYDREEMHNYIGAGDGDTPPRRRRTGSLDEPFLTAQERAALLAVSSRMERGTALPEGEDLLLLRRFLALVAALLPEEAA